MDAKPLINATLRAIITCTVLLFAIGTIVWCLLYGEPHNSLHASAVSWSYTLIIFTMLALGIDSAATTFIATAYGTVITKPPTP
jgi:ABC-type antimicrobial peptide transport system permease subunit